MTDAKNNAGYGNVGNRNAGNRNVGNRNVGNRNTGNRNTGNRNAGDRNAGDRNVGNRNVGNRNTGDRNAGNHNAGDRNAGNRNVGYLNTLTPKIVIFDIQTNIEYGKLKFPNYFFFDTILRIDASNMTDKEKKSNPLYGITGGYLKKLSDSGDKKQFMKDCWKLSFDNAEQEDVAKTLKLPHFSYEKFEKISGITKDMFDKKLGNGI